MNPLRPPVRLRRRHRRASTGFGRLIALDPTGRMAGIITKTDLMRAIQVRLATSAPPDARDASDLRAAVESKPLEPLRNVP